VLLKDRKSAQARTLDGMPLEVSKDLHDMIATKLWRNPCWLSFRVNFIGHHFNQPIYDYIARAWRLSAPEHVVLYALGLKEGVTADDIVVSSAKPKNTLSRAVNALLRKRLISRARDPKDRRRFPLRLTKRGRAIVEKTTPLFVEQEKAMAAALSEREQLQLRQLLTKIVLNQTTWPTRIEGRPT
jgi:DNA-binding MarR family transcriptional regulator